MELKNKRLQKVLFLSVIGFCAILLGITISITLKNISEMNEILEESIKSQLISTSIAARNIIDIDRFYAYNKIDDVLNDLNEYNRVLNNLRTLKRNVGAEYIYALKYIDGAYYFIFDTDYEEDTMFTEYELSDVHAQAFLGQNSAGIMNVVDEFGSFNTGAVPIWKEGKVIGIVSTDI